MAAHSLPELTQSHRLTLTDTQCMYINICTHKMDASIINRVKSIVSEVNASKDGVTEREVAKQEKFFFNDY